MSGERSISVTTVVAVGPQDAFEVFTQEVDAWWCRGPRFRFLPDVPARLRFEFRALAFEPGDRTEVEVRFEPVAGGTRVTIDHRGWEAFPDDHPVRHGLTGEAFDNMMNVWWGDQLVSLRRRAVPRER